MDPGLKRAHGNVTDARRSRHKPQVYPLLINRMLRSSLGRGQKLVRSEPSRVTGKQEVEA